VKLPPWHLEGTVLDPLDGASAALTLWPIADGVLLVAVQAHSSCPPDTDERRK
jgi:hypothetical protein